MNKWLKSKLMYKSSVFADIVIGISIILAGYFYYYENKKIIYSIANPERINNAVKIIVCVIIIVIWLGLCFQNGVKKRRSFLAWTLCLWIVPQIVKYIVDTFAPSVYSTPIQQSFVVFTKYLANINYLSLKTVGDIIENGTGFPYYITLNIMIMLFEVIFLLGLFAADRITGTDSTTEKDNGKRHI